SPTIWSGFIRRSLSTAASFWSSVPPVRLLTGKSLSMVPRVLKMDGVAILVGGRPELYALIGGHQDDGLGTAARLAELPPGAHAGRNVISVLVLARITG